MVINSSEGTKKSAEVALPKSRRTAAIKCIDKMLLFAIEDMLNKTITQNLHLSPYGKRTAPAGGDSKNKLAKRPSEMLRCCVQPSAVAHRK